MTSDSFSHLGTLGNAQRACRQHLVQNWELYDFNLHLDPFFHQQMAMRVMTTRKIRARGLVAVVEAVAVEEVDSEDGVVAVEAVAGTGTTVTEDRTLARGSWTPLSTLEA